MWDAFTVVLLILAILFLLVIIGLVIWFTRTTPAPTNPTTCTSGTQCLAGFVCAPASSTATVNTCLPGLGGSCSTTTPCAPGFTCTNGTCVVTTPPTTKAKMSALPGPVTGKAKEEGTGNTPLPTIHPVLSAMLQGSSPAVNDRFALQPVRSATRYFDPLVNSAGRPSRFADRFTVPSSRTVATGDDDQDSVSNVSTVCAPENDYFVCRPSADKGRYSSPIIHVASFSDFIAYLLADGHIICTKGQSSIVPLSAADQAPSTMSPSSYRVKNNVALSVIAPFAGYLHGLGKDGILYRLPNNYLVRSEWVWRPVDFTALRGISHMSNSHDGRSLWIQVGNKGYRYNNDEVLQESTDIPPHSYRQLGLTADKFIIYSPREQLALDSEGKQYEGVSFATLTHTGEVKTLGVNSEYSKIVIANWRCHYIRK